MLGKIKKHELRKIWKNEASDFTTWLEENLDCLSDALGFEITLIKREQKVGAFSVDILAEDESGQKVIIENQLEKTDHTHLGQIITYVSNLESQTVIWISSSPRQEHINAVNWLNTQTQLNFYLVMVEAISVDDSKPAPLFQVICKPDSEIKIAAAESSEFTERERFNLQFWSEINRKCIDKLPGITSRSPRTNNNHAQASGKSGLRFVFLATSKYYGIELYIDTRDAHINESILKQLEYHRLELESEFGAELDFDAIPDKRACRIRYVISSGSDIMELNQDKVQDELIKHMIKFQSVIKPRIKSLDFSTDEAA